jgi:hypothetical protein
METDWQLLSRATWRLRSALRLTVQLHQFERRDPDEGTIRGDV